MSSEMIEFFESLEPVGDLFVGSWGYDVEVDPSADTFYFNHEQREIAISPRLVAEIEMGKAEAKFVFEHELGHFSQLMDDPDAYVGTFDTAEEKAEELAEEHPEYEDFAEKSWHQFFNVFLDVHDNSRVQDRDPDFRSGGPEQDTPKELYEILFPEEKMKEGPLSQQFLNVLLRENMTGESIDVSEEIEEVLDEKFNVFGEQYTLQEFVDEIIGNPKHDIGAVVSYLEDFLYDRFEQLLRRDIEEENIELVDFPELDRGAGEGEEGGLMDKEVAEEVAEKHKENQKSPQDRGADEAADEFEEKMEEAGLSEQESKRITEIKERTRDQVKQLTKLWERFIQVSTEMGQAKEEGYKTGSSVSPTKMAEQLPILLSDPSQAEIFTREVPSVEPESVQPKEISLELVLDLSGSMDDDKRESVQEVAYALSKSLINFYRNSRLDFELEGKDNPISIDLNTIGFGNNTAAMLEQSSLIEEGGEKEEDLDQKLAQTVTKIMRSDIVDEGGTRDASALRQVQDYLTQSEFKQDLEQDENLSIVLEITDGETQTQQESKQIIEELDDQTNVYPRAIQIPGPIYDEGEEKSAEEAKEGQPEVKPTSGTFGQVWEDRGRKLKDLSALKDTVVQVLYDAIENQQENK